MSEVIFHDQACRSFAHDVDRREADEDRAWAILYTAINQASAAEEVVRQLDAEPACKRSHLALYIRAKTTLRVQKAADARHQRIAAAIRQAVSFVFVRPIHWLRSLRLASKSVAIELLPPVQREPARARTTSLKRDPDFASAKGRFGSAANAEEPSGAESAEAPAAKAA
jgi:hypothetical protein